ncbi:MAG: SurA N-terminal domain-containing protein [Bacillota bacterium]|nr:SurA N-terminal domain-containing protein [Bacillota bacterium]
MRNNRILIVIGVIILALVLGACGIVRKDPEVDKNSAVAKVNGQIITKEEFNQKFELYKSSYEQQYGKDIWNKDIEGKKFIDVVKEQVVEKLILDRLILEAADKQGIAVTQEEVSDEIASIKEYFEDEQKYLDFLTSQGMTEEQFADQVKKDLIITKYRDKLVEDVTVSEKEVEDYYNENIKEFKKDRVKASHILLDTKEDAEKILERLKNGEDFSDLAEQYSVDPSAKSNKGDLGYFGYGDMVKPFEEAAFALEKGEISGIVETQFGYHIIKVFDKEIVDPIPFEEAKQEINSKLLYMAMEKEYNKKLAELKENAEIETYPKNMK